MTSGWARFPGAEFTKGLKSRFRLKFKSLILNLFSQQNVKSVVLDLADFTKQLSP